MFGRDIDSSCIIFFLTFDNDDVMVLRIFVADKGMGNILDGQYGGHKAAGHKTEMPHSALRNIVIGDGKTVACGNARHRCHFI